MLLQGTQTSVRFPKGFAVAADRPRAMEDRGAASAYGVGCEKATPIRESRCRCHPGAQGPVAESRGRNRHGCQRPSCGHGSGPTGDCVPEMPDCDQPRRASCSLCFVSPWVVLDAAFSSGGCVHFHLPVYTCRNNRVCAHAEARPALTQVVSKKAKAALSIPRQRFPRLSRGRQLRNGEDAANLHTLFPLRLATKCGDHALHDLLQQSDC